MEIDLYPPFIESHKQLDHYYYCPYLVEKIYKETLTALSSKCLILAGVGLRGIIDSGCKDLSIPGRDLELKINKLAKLGYISQRDSERLHGVRFLGNDAAHDIIEPEEETINIALKIIEHLLTSLYILPKLSDGKIDTAISEFSMFLEMIEEKLSNLSVGDEIPIVKIFGKDRRRIQGALANLENTLIEQIKASTYTKLQIGKVDKYGAWTDNLQHFIVT
jgi:hypothetical protein